MLWRSLRALQVYGANTDVGKTIVSTLLCRSVQRQKQRAAFLKPVSTGEQDDADDRHLRRFGGGATTRCLYQFDKPVSPHLVAREVNDETLLRRITTTLDGWHRDGFNLALVETAGGVHSPGPNGNSQADLYRPLRLPVVLIADSRLGGISSSISAYESLLLRGYDVQSVLLFRDDYYLNHEYLGDYFHKKDIPLRPLPAPPARPEEDGARERDAENMENYYEGIARGDEIKSLLDEMAVKHQARLDRLDSMADRAHDLIWYPFTQHQGMTPRDIGVIDSAYDDHFQMHSAQTESKLQPAFDGSASWWTQGLGHGNPDLALSAAYAAGRYGHVMFAGNVHEPALQLAERLLETLDNPRLRKVFYTDNGSTGMEVAVKMGLRAACARYGWDARQEDVQILGLKGSYHGDTMGVMDCSEPSTFNRKVEWYRGRGFWLDFPRVTMTQGVWQVDMGDLGEAGEALGMSTLEFASLQEVFDLEERSQSETAQRYRDFIYRTVHEQTQKGTKFGALILEPVILGAGGMLLCDPLFQRCLVDVVRENPSLFHPAAAAATVGQDTQWSGLPVIFDEVFTGLYRLGRRTAASFLGVDPDITVNAKLLTGGLVPLCTTVASQEIFDAFSSADKSDALLHGHSYTAHAVGCQVGVEALRRMAAMERGGQWAVPRRLWQDQHPNPSENSNSADVWSLWSPDVLRNLSQAESVEGLYALGTVLVISLRDVQGQGGYTSTAAQGLQQQLASQQVHSRVLGNVLYVMASLTTGREQIARIEGLLSRLVT